MRVTPVPKTLAAAGVTELVARLLWVDGLGGPKGESFSRLVGALILAGLYAALLILLTSRWGRLGYVFLSADAMFAVNLAARSINHRYPSRLNAMSLSLGLISASILILHVWTTRPERSPLGGFGGPLEVGRGALARHHRLPFDKPVQKDPIFYLACLWTTSLGSAIPIMLAPAKAAGPGVGKSFLTAVLFIIFAIVPLAFIVGLRNWLRHWTIRGEGRARY